MGAAESWMGGGWGEGVHHNIHNNGSSDYR